MANYTYPLDMVIVVASRILLNYPTFMANKVNIALYYVFFFDVVDILPPLNLKFIE